MNAKFYPTLTLVLLFLLLAMGYFQFNKNQEAAISMQLKKETLEAMNPSHKEELENVVKEVIKKNPELIIESIRDLNTRKAKEEFDRMSAMVKAKTKELEEDSDDPRIGNMNAKIKLEEFFDYNCGYCKRMIEIKKKLIEENSDLQIVFKELPILGEASVNASKAALAVNMMDKSKYFQFHTELLNLNGPKTPDAIEGLAVKVGLDLAKFREALKDPKLDQIIAKNMHLAEEIGVNGTPAYVLAGEFLPGAVPYDEFKNRIDRVRSAATQPIAATPDSGSAAEKTPAAAQPEPTAPTPAAPQKEQAPADNNALAKPEMVKPNAEIAAPNNAEKK